MKALIVEDKAYIRKGLISMLELVDFKVDVIGECESVQEALIVTKSCKPDLIFLDINLTDGTAFDFLDQTTYSEFKIIFITAYEEFALRALKIGAVDYILKPVDFEELQAALNKVKNLPNGAQKQQLELVKQVWFDQEDIIVLSMHDSYQVIDLKTLMYCESDKGYTTFYCHNGEKHLVSKTLKEFEARLSRSKFVRPHQSYMVNLNYINKYDKSGVIHLQNGRKIPVSSRNKSAFSNLFIGPNS